MNKVTMAISGMFAACGLYASSVDVAFLKDLIRIPSVSADVAEVNKVADFTRRYAEAKGLFCTIETNAAGRSMVWVANVKGKRPDVLLSAHLDVVKAQSPDLFTPKVADGRLYGRGAGDCKEHVALSLHLMERLAGRVSIGAILGTDEEMGGSTTAEMMKRGYGAEKLVIVLDSEQFAITTVQKGLARYVLEASAPPVHAGLVKGAPPNAVRDLLRNYEKVEAEIPNFEDGSWRDMMTLERVSGDRNHAEIEICVRWVRHGGFERIEELLRKTFKSEPRCLRRGEAVLLDETQPYLVEFRERMRRKWPERNVDFFHLNSSTDARHLQWLDKPMLILGVDARGAHRPDEYVELRSLDEYAELISSYLIDKFGCAAVPANVPELLTAFNGEKIATREQWEALRAPELLEEFTREEYGRRPVERPESLSFTSAEPDEVVMDGKALRKRIRVEYAGPYGKGSFAFTAFIPRQSVPAPAFLLICNRDPNEKLDPERMLKPGFWPVEEIVGRGYATIAFWSGDISPDRQHGRTLGVFTAFDDVEKQYRAKDGWGMLSAWAWGASRVMDWIEAEPLLDAKHVAVVGHSRGGKTALVAGVYDKRFAMACSNDSGCSGAKLNHIDLPKSEHVANIVRTFQFWFCLNYTLHANKEREWRVDQHEFIALMAPRLVCIASASEDDWAGPEGEWWAAKLASPVWGLYGKKGLVADGFPPPETPQQEGCISYHLRTGKHGLTPYDWKCYMDFADRHGWRSTVKQL